MFLKMSNLSGIIIASQPNRFEVFLGCYFFRKKNSFLNFLVSIFEINARYQISSRYITVYFCYFLFNFTVLRYNLKSNKIV